MRLESIKLAGFKSFVDPTTLAFPSNLTAIVGPNGCGKSNIIDAIRWVMGESSAKQLRGQSLDDVIFNGCTTRKPLGQASIELNFDNSDGRLGGQYSSYAQLSIRREITREGQSTYYLNGSRCRRRDIRDIFLGTGLGPRSYAIIEQGMISRVVEAKPEELRAYVEEAAGISKYKERRRETEMRLAHTQENLNRLNDICEELNKQAKHLQRQANAAERYKALKQEERSLKAQLLALRYRNLHQRLEEALGQIEETETQVNSGQSEQLALQQRITHEREQQTILQSDCNQLQDQFYALGNTITRLEEQYASQQQQQKQQQQEFVDLTHKQGFLQQQYEDNQQQTADLRQSLVNVQQECEQLQLQAEKSQLQLNQTEQQFSHWQEQWETFQAAAAQLSQQQHIVRTQSQHYKGTLQSTQQRLERLTKELKQHQSVLDQNSHLMHIDTQLTSVQNQHDALQAEQPLLKQHALEKQAQLKQLNNEIDQLKITLQTQQGRLASLIALQKEALGQQETSLNAWLAQQQWADLPRLAQLLQVETGWEHAIEAILHTFMQAVCLTHSNLKDAYPLKQLYQLQPPQQSLTLITQTASNTNPQLSARLDLPLLANKLTAPCTLSHLFNDVYILEELSEADHYIKQLQAHESMVTRDGVHIGSHWIRWPSTQTAQTGTLQREREINTLKSEQPKLSKKLQNLISDQNNLQKQLQDLEKEQFSLQQSLSNLFAQQADLKTQHQVKNLQLTQAQQRLQSIEQEKQEISQQHENAKQQLEAAQQQQHSLQLQLEDLEKQRQQLLMEKHCLQQQLKTATEQAKRDNDAVHQLAMRRQTTEYQLNTHQDTLLRLQQQQAQIKKRLECLQNLTTEHSLNNIKQELEKYKQQQLVLSEQLKRQRNQLQQLTQQLKQWDAEAQQLAETVHFDQDDLAQRRLQCQELQVRAKTLEEQLQEYDYTLEQLLQQLPETAQINDFESQLEEMTHRLERIGAVNLAALDEHQAVMDRKNYLDTQHQDLSAAIATLQAAIQQMDKETRERFKETFDKVNQHFADLFPRLFSGGEASLQLQENDLLNSGICILAQPPGKRTSRIQLLSGGEKALTATALVFSFFQLNPAPFCMLDEVDAPLDDTNVLRFCNLVKEMAKEVQFIFISHNKVAIEMAQHLAGVTMHEPGVSRLVAVDVEKAVALAEMI